MSTPDGRRRPPSKVAGLLYGLLIVGGGLLHRRGVRQVEAQARTLTPSHAAGR